MLKKAISALALAGALAFLGSCGQDLLDGGSPAPDGLGFMDAMDGAAQAEPDLSAREAPAPEAASAQPKLGAILKKGIDVSVHNGSINWAQVKAAGIKFAILRCGYGDNYSGQDDARFAANVSGCVANGIPYGVYLYSYATHSTGSASVASEIDHARRLLSGKKPFCVYYDMEDSSTTYLGKTTLTNFAVKFCDALRASGYKVGVYANTNWFTNYLNAPLLYGRGYSLWVADYRGYCGYSATDIDMWQYTSGGSCGWISGNVDMNYLYHDITGGGSAPTPTPTPSSSIHVTYQTYDDVSRSWLPNVTDTQDYAGIYGHDVDCLYANLSRGNVTYKVHRLGGGWLPAVRNRSDYAGIYGSPIDGLMMTTDTGKTIHYRVHLRGGSWLPYVTGYNSTDGNNGYAGILGKAIDGVQVYVN